ncbi:DUF1684 domain-containing protein [Pontibacter silvestris]|uniref:DUF1684 domain-containing protein n=1 Tax=Pontibacter silvestris TaxID=2305183 RepID=A0ABW4X3A1_9BACT|nr:DUF1684 domain-containing protein [Pontibacter silvestris]MCC9134905.1 DUF1684 domain-containing protein [Pontibacter silvestris]
MSAEWSIPARLDEPALPRTVQLTDVLGQTKTEASKGTLVFSFKGQEYHLEATDGGNQLFVIFADKTNGTETYGAGRFLYVDKPGWDGKTVLDFNKEINPLCAFTAFATCPLPPKDNMLPLTITAGEKVVEEKHSEFKN